MNSELAIPIAIVVVIAIIIQAVVCWFMIGVVSYVRAQKEEAITNLAKTVMQHRAVLDTCRAELQFSWKNASRQELMTKLAWLKQYLETDVL